MAYSELIKNFEKVRAYMREFYVYGFKSRTEYDAKSARSYPAVASPYRGLPCQSVFQPPAHDVVSVPARVCKCVGGYVLPDQHEAV